MVLISSIVCRPMGIDTWSKVVEQVGLSLRIEVYCGDSKVTGESWEMIYCSASIEVHGETM